LQKDRLKKSQLARELPELAFFQKTLALDIEALRKDLMKFIFSNIDDRDWSKEFYLVIDVSSENYKGNQPGCLVYPWLFSCIAIECVPLLDKLDCLVNELNQHRDFYLFLKLVRKEFVILVKSMMPNVI
jgi:kinetochore protein Spc25, fungi type